jgi:ATP-binding cassette subfamily B protein
MLIKTLQSFRDNRTENNYRFTNVYEVLIDSIKSNPVLYCILAILIIFASCLPIGLQYVLKIVIDNFTISTPNISILYDNMWYCIVMVVLVMLDPICWSISGIIGSRMYSQARGRIRKQMFSYLLHHNRTYFENNHSGALTTKIKTAGDSVDEMFCLITWSFFPIIIRAIAVAIGLAFVNIYLSLFVIVGFILYAVVLKKYASTLANFESRFSNARSTSMGRLADTLTNNKTVSSYTNSMHEIRLARNTINFEEYRHYRSWSYKNYVQLIQDCFTAIIALLIIGGSFYLWSEVSITIGTMVMVVTFVITIINEAKNVADAALNFSKHSGSLKDSLDTIYKTLDILPMTIKKPIITKYNINFHNVCFSYDNINNILTNFNLNIPNGQSIGIVGPSGSGKSTIISLIGRYYNINSGEIMIDGVNTNDMNLDDMRKLVSVVPQRPEIFSRTIFDNILYGRLGASEDDVIKAAKLAHAHEFIIKLPKGYETVAGENGIKLSGGQAQRIAIARAFLKNAPILILDEATSALDSESEYLIHQSLEDLIKGKTTIAIAHRLSTLKSMDRIVVMKNGCIIEDGDHKSLTNIENGEYNKLWSYQSMV